MLLMHLGILAVLLFFSFVFSGSEIAYFTLSRKHLYEEPGRIGRWMRQLLAKPHRFLVMVLTANLAVNSFASSLYSVLTGLYFAFLVEPWKTVWDVISFTLVLLLVSEVSPKALALTYPRTFARWSAAINLVVYYLLSPLLVPLSALVAWLSRFGIQAQPPLTEEEILQLVRGSQEPALKLLERGVLFLSHTVQDIATPRKEIKALPYEATLEEALDLFRATRHSRFPVFQGTLDHVVGFIEIPQIMRSGTQDFQTPIRRFLQRPLFVPESLNLLQFVRKFRAAGARMAIVVDEYGGTDGLVTMGDIARFFFGTLAEEFEEEPLLIKRVGPRDFILPGDLELSRFAEITGVNLGDAGTLSALILEHLGRIPREGEAITIGNVEFFVLAKEGETLTRLKVHLKEAPHG